MAAQLPSYSRHLPDPWIADARLDPWVIVPVRGDEFVLYGYAAAHPLTGGLSWLRSSPVRALDVGQHRAMTMSGRRYDLGHRLEAHKIPSLGLEAWLAYDLLVSGETEDELVPPVSADPDRERTWLATQKVARHLGVQAPSLDPDDVAKFVRRYRRQYFKKRNLSERGEY